MTEIGIESFEALTNRADANAISCSHFCAALRRISEVSTEPHIVRLADDALLMPWHSPTFPVDST